ncbi:MAG: sigma-54-dependent Fis family transcriptional regulator [Deltaproteobacteria bacterium]|nr:sigma-54-dependent Fis family transcriptional regulator [Deltaproteobacteria bacterium]
MARVLIVDDEAGIRSSIAGILGDEGFETTTCEDGEAALRSLAQDGLPELLLLDIAMPGRDGVEILADVRGRWPDLPVVMMSGHGTVETAVRTTRLGAFDFIEKPLSIDKLLLTIEHALERSRLECENARLRAQNVQAREIIGDSQSILRLKQQIDTVAPSDGRVLITGENGTGKELVARQIHLRSKFADGPFVEMNCAAIPEDLIESELFGHEKGAFTGAVARKRGRFEIADGGTIFLDEVADMSLMTQAKVLRMLQEQKFERVGGTETIQVGVRVIAATNRNLEEEIAAGRYREDLYYRLNVLPFRVPSLRERSEDIPVLARAFIAEFCAAAGVQCKKLTPEAERRLMQQTWPGNVRELRNLMERLVIMLPGETIGASDLPTPSRAVPTPGNVGLESGTLGEARRNFEREFLIARLRANDWNISRSAESVGIARESLSRKIKSLKIEVDRG